MNLNLDFNPFYLCLSLLLISLVGLRDWNNLCRAGRRIRNTTIGLESDNGNKSSKTSWNWYVLTHKLVLFNYGYSNNDCEPLDRLSIEEYSRDFKNSVLTSINANANNIVMEPCASSVHESPDDFEILSVLGKGAYGVVFYRFILCYWALRLFKSCASRTTRSMQWRHWDLSFFDRIDH